MKIDEYYIGPMKAYKQNTTIVLRVRSYDFKLKSSVSGLEALFIPGS